MWIGFFHSTRTMPGAQATAKEQPPFQYAPNVSQINKKTQPAILPINTTRSFYEHSLLYPPFATFDVDVVKAVLSSLVDPVSEHEHLKIAPSPDGQSNSQGSEAETLKALLIGIDIHKPTKERNATSIPIARELAFERRIIAAIGGVRHRQ